MAKALVPVLILAAALAAPAFCDSTVASLNGQIQLDPAPPSVLPGDDLNNAAATLFIEGIDITLGSAVSVDASGTGIFDTNASLNGGTIAAGTVVNSTYLNSDPGLQAGGTNLTGSITFSTAILGVISHTATLNATDSIFADPSVTYPVADSQRGFELVPGQDEFTISPDGLTLSFSVVTWNNVDDLRIITAGSGSTTSSTGAANAPEPGTVCLLIAGFAALAGWRKKLSA